MDRTVRQTDFSFLLSASDQYACSKAGWMSFFFSSRRRHTRSLCDWSSDVCSSDLTRRATRSARLLPLPQVGRRVTDREQASRPGRASRLPRDPLQNPVMTDDRGWGDVRHASEHERWANEAVESTSGCTLAGKSTRLNSSHTVISYAVFCLKKKKHIHRRL